MTTATSAPPVAARDRLEPSVVKQWFADRGDQTLRITYPLTHQSIVLDVGGYEGNWAAQIDERYGCTIHIFEPVPDFAVRIEQRFHGRTNVHIHRYGLSNHSGQCTISIDHDASSIHKAQGIARTIQLRSADEVLAELLPRQQVDLIKINIEGCEYELLEHLHNTGLIRRLRDIQVQFHDFVPDAARRMESLQRQLSATHALTWQYRFVWENWRHMSS